MRPATARCGSAPWAALAASSGPESHERLQGGRANRVPDLGQKSIEESRGGTRPRWSRLRVRRAAISSSVAVRRSSLSVKCTAACGRSSQRPPPTREGLRPRARFAADGRPCAPARPFVDRSVLSVPCVWFLVWTSRQVAALAPDQLVPGVALATAVAAICDGVALTWFPALYGEIGASRDLGAAWLLWGVGVGLILTLVIARRDCV